jgi:uncharacterized SAM-binding protein YcdF (DUF218 family)
MLWRGRVPMAAGVFVGQLGLLWALSAPWTAARLLAWIESDYPVVTLEDTAPADVAVVLGGGLSREGTKPVENLGEAADRVLRGARLYRAGKVTHVLAVGGRLPWTGAPRSEAEAMGDLLEEWGVAPDAIVLESSSQNTRENALGAARVIRGQGWSRILLVTSAAHMPRAVEAFRAVGIDVVASPTDYRYAGPSPLDVLDFLPDAGALAQSTAVVYEIIGRWVYRWRGWAE